MRPSSLGSDRPVDQPRYVVKGTRPPCLAHGPSRPSPSGPMATLKVFVSSTVGEQFSADMHALVVVLTTLVN